MKFKFALISLIVCFLFGQTGIAQTKVTREDYLQVIKDTEAAVWQEYEKEYQKWQNSDPAKRFKEPPLSQFGHGGIFDALLYQVTGEKIYDERARKLLLQSDAGN